MVLLLSVWLQEYFSKLKFNYIEYETKRVFLESLKKPKDEIMPTKEYNAELGTKGSMFIRPIQPYI